MAEVEQYAQDLKDIMKELTALSNRIRPGCSPSEWSLDQVMNSFLSIFDRFCPLKIGDRVELVKNLPIEESSGWYSCRHFLIRGAMGTVEDRGYRDDKFTFDIIFDNETWIDREGVEREVDRKHTFSLSEDVLRLIR